MIEYTAKRTLSLGHVENSSYTLDLDVVDATSEVRDVKESPRSAGGATETSFERQDVYWTIQLAPVGGSDVGQLLEFLDSIESGETFRVWLVPEDVVPLVLKCESAESELGAFIRTGSEANDLFSAQFTALQAAPYDITGLTPGGGSGGFEGGDSDSADLYDPEEGGPTGGLDAPALTGTFTITAEALPILLGIEEIGFYDTISNEYGALVSAALPPGHEAQILSTVEVSGDRYLQLSLLVPTESAPTQDAFDHLSIPGVGEFDAEAAEVTPFGAAFEVGGGTGAWVATWNWGSGVTLMADAADYTATLT